MVRASRSSCYSGSCPSSRGRHWYFLLRFIVAAEAKSLSSRPSPDNLVQTHECAAADEQNVRRIYRGKFLMWMLASPLRWNVGDRSFQNLQQSLLHTLAGNIAGNRRILVLTADFVDFVNVDDARLCPPHVTIGGL